MVPRNGFFKLLSPYVIAYLPTLYSMRVTTLESNASINPIYYTCETKCPMHKCTLTVIK